MGSPVALSGSPLAVLRHRQWAHFLVLPLAGLDSHAHWARLLGGVALTALSLGYAYGVNAISDRATDLDGRKNPLMGLASCPRSVAALVAACAALALAGGLLTGLVPLGAVAISLLASTLYSLGPRWKAVPALGTALNAAIFAPLLFSASSGALPPSLSLVAVTFCALLLQNQLLHEQADAAEDAAARVRTTARLLGPRGTRLLVLALTVAGAALAIPLAPSIAGAVAAVLALIAGACVALASPAHATTSSTAARDPLAARRLVHRAIAFAGGALVFAVARLW